MANELSRVSDRLARARERTWDGTARVWLPNHARREPARVEPDSRRDAGAEAKRVPATLVAIHVEVRHPTGDAEPTARVINAHVAEVDDPEDYRYDEALPVDEEVIAQVAEPPPFFALPAYTREEASGTQKPSGIFGRLRYFAARALSAYLTQHTFNSSASPREGRMLDLRA